jgi:hypothetical protein
MKNQTPNKIDYTRIKKEIITQPIDPEPPTEAIQPPTDWLKSECEEMRAMWSWVSPTQQQIDRIGFYYKKYINPNFSGKFGNCNGCPGSVAGSWGLLRAWWSHNNSKFIN